MILWHFTCEHSHAILGKTGLLLPNLHPLLPEFGGIVWMTEEADPDRDAVGLSSRMLSCDRMAYRYEVAPAPPSCVRWSSVRHRAHASALRDMEAFGKPETWWISGLPVRGTLAPIEVSA